MSSARQRKDGFLFSVDDNASVVKIPDSVCERRSIRIIIFSPYALGKWAHGYEILSTPNLLRLMGEI